MRQFRFCGARVAPRSLSTIQQQTDQERGPLVSIWIKKIKILADGRAEETGSRCMFLLAVGIEIGEPLIPRFQPRGLTSPDSRRPEATVAQHERLGQIRAGADQLASWCYFCIQTNSTFVEQIADCWMRLQICKVAGRSTLKNPLGSCPVISVEVSLRACEWDAPSLVWEIYERRR